MPIVPSMHLQKAFTRDNIVDQEVADRIAAFLDVDSNVVLVKPFQMLELHTLEQLTLDVIGTTILGDVDGTMVAQQTLYAERV